MLISQNKAEFQDIAYALGLEIFESKIACYFDGFSIDLVTVTPILSRNSMPIAKIQSLTQQVTNKVDDVKDIKKILAKTTLRIKKYL